MGGLLNLLEALLASWGQSQAARGIRLSVAMTGGPAFEMPSTVPRTHPMSGPAVPHGKLLLVWKKHWV